MHHQIRMKINIVNDWISYEGGTSTYPPEKYHLLRAIKGHTKKTILLLHLNLSIREILSRSLNGFFFC